LLVARRDVGAPPLPLCALLAAEAVARLRSGSGGRPGFEPERPDAAAGAVVAKRRLHENPALQDVVARLARHYGVESGIAGRDIAPLLFVGSGEDGYVELAQSDGTLLAWSYTGAPAARARVFEELVAYAEERKLRPTVLSPTPI